MVARRLVDCCMQVIVWGVFSCAIQRCGDGLVCSCLILVFLVLGLLWVFRAKVQVTLRY